MFKSFSRILFFTSLFAAVLLMANYASAAAKTTGLAIDSALNNSLEETKELDLSVNHNLKKPPEVSRKQAARQAVEINLDAPDADQAASYTDVQASGSLRDEN